MGNQRVFYQLMSLKRTCRSLLMTMNPDQQLQLTVLCLRRGIPNQLLFAVLPWAGECGGVCGCGGVGRRLWTLDESMHTDRPIVKNQHVNQSDWKGVGSPHYLGDSCIQSPYNQILKGLFFLWWSLSLWFWNYMYTLPHAQWRVNPRWPRRPIIKHCPHYDKLLTRARFLLSQIKFADDPLFPTWIHEKKHRKWGKVRHIASESWRVSGHENGYSGLTHSLKPCILASDSLSRFLKRKSEGNRQMSKRLDFVVNSEGLLHSDHNPRGRDCNRKSSRNGDCCNLL